MKQGLSLGFSQSLTLTPQLQQSIRLLQLSSLELEQEIEQQLATNPFLERDDDDTPYASQATPDKASVSTESERDDAADASSDSSDDTLTPSADDLDWDGDGTLDMQPNDTEWGVEAGSASASHQQHESDFDPLGGLSTATSLTEYLKRQAQHLRLSPTDAASLDFLIESLDERGFLTESLEELATSLSSDTEDIERLVEQLQIAKQWLQNLDPCGVGAADVTECLRLQLKEKPNAQIAMRLLDVSLPLLARRNIKQLSSAANCPEALIQEGLQLISTLEPVPARRFAQANNSVVIPDVYVRAVRKPRSGTASLGAHFVAELNTDLMPRLKVDEITARLLKMNKARETKNEAMQQALMEARGFIKAVSQRFDTVLRVAKAIVARQGLFFQHGAVAMRPLVLRDIADELGLHESTVSRVTTSKYMSTPQGTFEFKYFFDASLGTEAGGETSGTAVRALIAQLIAAEKKTKPLSDGKLADLLAEQGIECARRTVAKYREAMRIPTASLRKAA
ncbi:MAG: hypothetical protein RLY82_810 [Pseudomonadota bacterium]